MGAIQIIDELSRHGASVFLDGAEVKVGLTKDVPNDLLIAAKHYKSELINLLRGKANRPAIWDVTLRNGNAVSPMVVIDPARESVDQFMAGLIDRFGPDKVLSATRREIM